MRFSVGADLIAGSDPWLAGGSGGDCKDADAKLEVDRSWARIVRAVRFFTPIFCINFVTYDLTVRSSILRLFAISRLELPSSNKFRTCCSRMVKLTPWVCAARCDSRVVNSRWIRSACTRRGAQS